MEYRMKEIGPLLFLAFPTLLAMVLLYVRTPGRRLVPFISIVFNIALAIVVALLSSGQSGHSPPAGYITYPFICLAALLLGLIIEVVLRVVKQRSNQGNDLTDRTKERFLLKKDILTLCIVLLSPVVFFAERLTGTLAYFIFILLSAIALTGTKPRWISVVFYLQAGMILLSLFMERAVNSGLHNTAGVKFFFSPLFCDCQRHLHTLLMFLFGMAIYTLCQKIRQQPRDVIESPLSKD
jgi:hypothetical protein